MFKNDKLSILWTEWDCICCTSVYIGWADFGFKYLVDQNFGLLRAEQILAENNRKYIRGRGEELGLWK